MEALSLVASLELSGLVVLMLRLEVESWRNVPKQELHFALEEAVVDR